MKRSLRVSALFGVLVVILCGSQVKSVDAQGSFSRSRSSITGFVFTPDRRPISQIWVELTTDMNSTVGRVRTDGSGRFYFPGLANGRYTIKVLPFGTNFEAQSEDVELAGVGSRGQSLPENLQKDIYLKARKGVSAPSSSQVVFAQDVPPAAKSIYDSAVVDLESQRTDQGIAGLEKSITAFPQYFAALMRLGTLRIGEKQFEEAIPLFERALVINKRCSDCHYGIAYSNFHLRRFTEAISSAEKGIAENADSGNLYLVLGMAARSLKDHERAEKALQRAVKVTDGQNADAHWQLALLYGRDLERFADAAKELELYLKVVPDAPNKKDVKNLIKQFKDKAKLPASST